MAVNNDKKIPQNNRYHILDYEQIFKLNQVIKEKILLSPRTASESSLSLISDKETAGILEVLERSCGNYPQKKSRKGNTSNSTNSSGQDHKNLPIIHVQLRNLIRVIRDSLINEGILVKDIRLNGGAAAYVLKDGEKYTYNDIDLIFNIDLSDNKLFNNLKTILTEAVLSILQRSINLGHYEEASKKDDSTDGQEETDPFIQLTPAMVKQYIRKMVRINRPGDATADSWSLLSLGHPTMTGCQTVELKFVHHMKRQYEFSVDSFQINLDSLLSFYKKNQLTEHFHPIVVAESVCGNYGMALNHLKEKIIYTEKPEEIRGGGLLKYCKLLVKGFRPLSTSNIHLLERYMCSRFFIDFPFLSLQYAKLTSYLREHFTKTDHDKIFYLQILYEVVSNSTVCLMTHEYQQTLILIASLVQHVFCNLNDDIHNLNLSEFSDTNSWAVDKIHYGTSHFPKYINGRLFACSWLSSSKLALRLSQNSDIGNSEMADNRKTLQLQEEYRDTAPENKKSPDLSLTNEKICYSIKKKFRRENISRPRNTSVSSTKSEPDPLPELFSEVEFPRLIQPI